MCGIVVTNTLNNLTKAELLSRIKRRGPDHQNIRQYGDLYIGHSRLSILDLDVRSNQPFESKTYVLTFNGEIYNYKELRIELKQKGHKFSTNSDTEVLLAMYREYGKECLHRIRGMFAFCIHNMEENSLFFARDITGQKPLYYFFNDNKISISSSLMLIYDLHKPKFNYTALEEFFRFRYIISEDSTPFINCSKLNPGYCGTVNLDDFSMSIEPYVDLSEDSYGGSFEEAKTALGELIQDSVKDRLISDVPLGVFLSGGLDSSLIAYYATKHSEELSTFSLGFDGLESNELKGARAVAKHLKTRHYECVVKPEEVSSALDDFFLAYEEPFADGSAIPSLILSKFAKSQMTVALSGDGADELFLGYNRYEYFSRLLWQQYIPLKMRYLFSYLSDIFRSKSWSRYLRFLGSRNMKELYYGVVSSFDTREFKSLPDSFGSDFNKSHPIKSAAIWDKEHYLPNDINQKVDRASMFFGLEVRSPFLDKRITDFASALPERYMYSERRKKHVLRSLLYDLMPSDLYTNKKSGFTAPLEIWIESLFKDEIIEYINGTDLLELPFIDIDGMRNKCNEHFTGKRKHTNMLWRVLVYKRWRQAYV